MGQKNPITTSFNLPDGREVTIETGKLATQAHGSVVVKCGNTMLFCSVVSAREVKPDQPYFPLFVDYQENFASTGRIPGNFFRREGRPNEHEILICRLVDRAIRPLFPDNYMNETQVVINLISADEETMPDAFAALAASAAFAVSDIPFGGPISEVRVAKVGGEYKVNPPKSEVEAAELDIIVAANKDNIMMVEGEADECSEKELVEAIRVGHEAIKTQCQAQETLAQKVGDKATPKREILQKEENEAIEKQVEENCKDKIYQTAKAALDKESRKEQFKSYLEELLEKVKEEEGEEYLERHGDAYARYYDELKKKVIRTMVLDEKVRLDGRSYDEVRPIWTEVGYLPSTHGSAIFNRGETQALATLTLGTKKDSQMLDMAQELIYDDFLLHYNFPPYSVGEVRPMRGPGRREIGHGNLAGRAIKRVMPQDIPYTTRIVSDIMESNGSSSMATVCAGSLALMDGGIQIDSPVSGIAMGMIKEGDKFAILSDILGDEDALGDMDFKVTGTKEGITACQMDIKIEGLEYDLLMKALEQARAGRLHILNEMSKTISEPREDLKPHAPRIKEIIIDKEFIGAVIGPGGKIIQDMQEETNTEINIEEVEDKGVIHISATNKDSIERAAEMIREITFTPEVGDVYDAKVAKVMPYGVFVDFKGKSGLLHVSEISHSHIKNVDDVFSVGDEVKVKLIGIDKKSGKFRLSRKVLIPKHGKESDNNE
jgi:polyribonucleotide nucleotidyltransferase